MNQEVLDSPLTWLWVALTLIGTVVGASAVREAKAALKTPPWRSSDRDAEVYREILRWQLVKQMILLVMEGLSWLLVIESLFSPLPARAPTASVINELVAPTLLLWRFLLTAINTFEYIENRRRRENAERRIREYHDGRRGRVSGSN